MMYSRKTVSQLAVVVALTTSLLAITDAFPLAEEVGVSEEGGSDICSLPKDPGPCYGLLYHYYYNTYTASCEQFVYGGCQGNENNFDTSEACKKACSKDTIEGGEEGGSEESCNLDSDPGPCFGYFSRYYYNTSTKSCENFIYGGCQGNDNKYETIEECNNKCRKQPEVATIE